MEEEKERRCRKCRHFSPWGLGGGMAEAGGCRCEKRYVALGLTRKGVPYEEGVRGSGGCGYWQEKEET